MSEDKQEHAGRLEKRRFRKKQRRPFSELQQDPNPQPLSQPLANTEEPPDAFPSDENTEPNLPSSLKLNLANHQKQVLSAIQASTERRNRATGLIKNHMYYDEANNRESTLGDLTNMPVSGVSGIVSARGVEEGKHQGQQENHAKSNRFKKKRVKRDVFQEQNNDNGVQNEEVQKPNIFHYEEKEQEGAPEKLVELSAEQMDPSLEAFVDKPETEEQKKEEQQQTLSDRTGGDIEPDVEMQGKPSEDEENIQDMTQRILNGKSPFNIEARKQFMTHPLPGQQTLKCYIQRMKESFKTMFRLITDAGTIMMQSQSQNGSVGCNYYISLTKQMSKNSQTFMGKLRSNFTGSQYMLFDGGQKAKKPSNKSRATLANVEYESNFMGLKGPRRLHIRIADLTKDMDVFRLAQNDTLVELNSINPDSVLIFKNKQPKWNSRINSYSLNFGGRVKMASIKNFIIENPTDSSKNLFVFGKVDENTFSLEFSNPFSPLQAFGIAISCFDFKLNCE